jgi:hypothetical protein
VVRINVVIDAVVMDDCMEGQKDQGDNLLDKPEGKNLSDSEKVGEPSVAVNSDHLMEETPVSDPSFSMHTAITLGLDFKAGENFAKEVLRKFSSPVHSLKGKASFTLVVSFGRASFRMNEENVALALEAALGGFCGSLGVIQLRDRVFSSE